MTEVIGSVYEPDIDLSPSNAFSVLQDEIENHDPDSDFPISDTYFGDITFLVPGTSVPDISSRRDRVIVDDTRRQYFTDKLDKLRSMAPAFASMVERMDDTLFKNAALIMPAQSEYSGWFLQNIAAIDWEHTQESDYEIIRHIADEYPTAFISASRFLERPVTLTDLQQMIPESLRDAALKELSLDQQLEIAAAIVYYGRDAIGIQQDVVLQDNVFYLDVDGFLPIRRKNRPAASHKDPVIRKFFLTHGHTMTAEEISRLLSVPPEEVDEMVRLAVISSMVPSLRIAEMAEKLGIKDTMLVLPGFRRKRTCLATEDKTLTELEHSLSNVKYGPIMPHDDDDDLEPSSSGMAVRYDFSDGTSSTFACKFDEWTAMTCVNTTNAAFREGTIYLPIGTRRFELESLKQNGEHTCVSQIDTSNSGEGVFLLNRECKNISADYIQELQEIVDELFTLEAA